MSFGYHLGACNGPLDAIAAAVAADGAALSSAAKGLIVSAALAGAAAGAAAGGALCDRFGRARALALCALPLLAGSALASAAAGYSAVVVGRLLVGVGIGAGSAVAPLLISEVAPTHLRGALGSSNQLFICVGILAALCANVAFGPAGWRATFALALVPAAAQLAGSLVVATESPSWLAAQGRTAEAAKAAKALWGEGARVPAAAADSGGSGAAVGWAAALSPRYRGPLLAGAALFLLQQFSGVNAIVYFSSDVFRSAGVPSEAAASAAVGLFNVLGTLAAMTVIERLGRRTLLMGSFAGMGAAMALMAATMAAGPGALPAAVSGGVALFGTLAYIVAFALGAGPVPALLVPEMNPEAVRSKVRALRGACDPGATARAEYPRERVRSRAFLVAFARASARVRARARAKRAADRCSAQLHTTRAPRQRAHANVPRAPGGLGGHAVALGVQLHARPVLPASGSRSRRERRVRVLRYRVRPERGLRGPIRA